MTGKPDRRVLLWMAGVAALAAVVRIAYVIEVHDHPLQMIATADPRIYDLRALEILRGRWLPDGVFFHSSPLYPYILAGIYGVFGHSYSAVRIVQSAVGVGTVLFLFSITRRLFGPREAVVTGVLSSLYVAFIFFDSELLMISFVVFFVVAALSLLLRYAERPSAGTLFAAGLLLGLAALGKPNVLLFVPAVLIWLFRRARRVTGTAGAMAAGRRTGVGLAAALVVGTVLPIAPATISNYRASGEFILTTSNGGINFYIGNNEEADGTFIVEQSMRENLYEGSKRYAERRLGRELTAGEVSSYWFRRGLRYAREHPLQELRLMGRKLLLFWNAYEIPNHYDINFFRTFSNVLRLNPFVFAWMVPVGIMGIYVSRRRWRDLMLLYLFLGTYMISILPFFVTSRYRLPAVPVVLIFAAHGLWWIWRRLKARERGGWTRPLIVLVAALVVVNLPIVDFTLGPSYAILGAIYRDMGRHELAVEQFRRATEESPGFDLAYSNMGAELGRLGEYREAEEALREALRLNPTLVVAHTNLGVIYTETGRFEDAREHLSRAAELEPTHKEAWVGLSRLGMATGDGALIERSLLKVLEIDPRDGPAHWNLAVLYSEDPAMRERSAVHARAASALSPELRGRAAELLRFLQGKDQDAGDR